MARSQEIAELRWKEFGGGAKERMGEGEFGGGAKERMGWVKESLGAARRHII